MDSFFSGVQLHFTIDPRKLYANEGGDEMENTSFMKVDEVAQELGVSKSYAYKIVQKLNEELKSKGFLTISGRVNKQYFMERTCYGAERKE